VLKILKNKNEIFKIRKLFWLKNRIKTISITITEKYLPIKLTITKINNNKLNHQKRRYNLSKNANRIKIAEIKKSKIIDSKKNCILVHQKIWNKNQ